MANICGIYQILNKATGKSYVGSSLCMHKIWGKHLGDLLGNCHHSIKLQRSWNKHGSEIWEWIILQECEEGQLRDLEAFWMAKLDSVDRGYNMIFLTLDGERVIRRHSKDSCERMSNSQRESHQKLSNEVKEERKKNKRIGHLNMSEEAKLEAKRKKKLTELNRSEAERARVSSNISAALTESYENSNRRETLSKTLLARSEEQKAETIIRRKETNQNKSNEEKARISKSRSDSNQNRSDERKAEISRNKSEGHLNRSDEAKAETSKRLSEAAKNRSAEKKAAKAAKTRATLLAKSDEEKAARVLKVRATLLAKAEAKKLKLLQSER